MSLLLRLFGSRQLKHSSPAAAAFETVAGACLFPVRRKLLAFLSSAPFFHFPHICLSHSLALSFPRPPLSTCSCKDRTNVYFKQSAALHPPSAPTQAQRRVEDWHNSSMLRVSVCREEPPPPSPLPPNTRQRSADHQKHRRCCCLQHVC